MTIPVAIAPVPLVDLRQNTDIIMGSWIEVSPQSASHSVTEMFRGVQVEVFASPHDVPRAVKGNYDHQLKRFVIVFRYLDEERFDPYPETSSDGIVRVYKGKSSGRIERIEVDVRKAKADAVTLNILTPEVCDQVEQALGALQSDTLSTRFNHLAVTEALEQSKAQLCLA